MTDPYCVRTTKRPLSGRGLGHVAKFLNFGTRSKNFGTNRAIRFKFGTEIEGAPLLRADHKTTPKWAWPGASILGGLGEQSPTFFKVGG